MSRRTHIVLSLLIASALFLTACQPRVDISRANVDLQAGLQPAPREAPLVPFGGPGQAPRPSANEGKRVFEDKAKCAVCHGPEGFGDGPAAAGLKSPGKSLLVDLLRLFGIRRLFGREIKGEQLPSRPANFHNVVAMRLNSPFSMFETVKRGRPNTAMPSFGPRPSYGAVGFGVKLTDADIWNVVFHEWAYTTSPEEVARGKQLYETRVVEVNGQPLTCAACHGTAGDGRGPVGLELSKKLWGWARGQGPGIFTDINLMAQRKPAELFQVIVDGRAEDMPGYRGRLTDDEVWALVNYIWTFIYDSPVKP